MIGQLIYYGYARVGDVITVSVKRALPGFDLKKKIIKINDKVINSSNQLLESIKIIWMTPQMNNIFSGQKPARKKFFDRVIANFLPNHLKDKFITPNLFDVVINIWDNKLKSRTQIKHNSKTGRSNIFKV